MKSIVPDRLLGIDRQLRGNIQKFVHNGLGKVRLGHRKNAMKSFEPDRLSSIDRQLRETIQTHLCTMDWASVEKNRKVLH